jgi:hypothetical protein
VGSLREVRLVNAARQVTRIVAEGDLTQRICDAVVKEMRVLGFISEPQPMLPPPCDLRAEREIVSAVLDGTSKPDDFPELKGKHFFSDLCGRVFCAVHGICDFGMEVTLERVQSVLEASGVSSLGLREELDLLAWSVPARARETLDAHAARIVELWRRRELISLIAKVDVRLRTDALDYDRAVAWLAKGI